MKLGYLLTWQRLCWVKSCRKRSFLSYCQIMAVYMMWDTRILKTGIKDKWRLKRLRQSFLFFDSSSRSAVSAILSVCLSSSAILNRNLKISAIFNFEITWASNPISLANWLIWLSPIHTFTAHGEESAFRGQKYQTWQIFSSRPCMAKFSGKLRRTREETAEHTALLGHLLRCFLSCVAA